MLARGLVRRLPALARLAQSSPGASSAALLDAIGFHADDDHLGNAAGVVVLPHSRSLHFSRGLSFTFLSCRSCSAQVLLCGLSLCRFRFRVFTLRLNVRSVKIGRF